ncbi:MAG TPA: MFS transporter [Methylomirabilota bacterium]|nr:MFS transporter [Methylomirabilota bacterium]
MELPGGLRALNHRDFRVYYAGQLVALTGTWMQIVAQSWLVLQLTASPLRLGLIGTLQFAPLLLFSLFTGAVADRLPKRRLLVATQSTQACLALGLAVLIGTGRVEYWHVAVGAVLWGVANALDQPTRQSFVVSLVGRADLISAVGLNSAAFNAARIVGPAIGGLLIARAGIALAFALNTLAFGIAITALLTVGARGAAPPRGGTTMLEEIREGVAYAVRSARVRLVLGLLAVTSFCVFNFSVYVPLLAREVLGLGSEGFGFLMAALGVGAVAAGLALGWIPSGAPPLAAMKASLATALAGLVALSAVDRFWLAALLLAVVGFAGTITTASCNTSLQLTAPDQLRGRVMSVYTLLSGGVFPLGAFWVGAVSEARGVSAAFLVNGALGLAALGALVAWWRTRRRRSGG